MSLSLLLLCFVLPATVAGHKGHKALKVRGEHIQGRAEFEVPCSGPSDLGSCWNNEAIKNEFDFEDPCQGMKCENRICVPFRHENCCVGVKDCKRRAGPCDTDFTCELNRCKWTTIPEPDCCVDECVEIDTLACTFTRCLDNKCVKIPVPDCEDCVAGDGKPCLFPFVHPETGLETARCVFREGVATPQCPIRRIRFSDGIQYEWATCHDGCPAPQELGPDDKCRCQSGKPKACTKVKSKFNSGTALCLDCQWITKDCQVEERGCCKPGSKRKCVALPDGKGEQFTGGKAICMEGCSYDTSPCKGKKCTCKEEGSTKFCRKVDPEQFGSLRKEKAVCRNCHWDTEGCVRQGCACDVDADPPVKIACFVHNPEAFPQGGWNGVVTCGKDCQWNQKGCRKCLCKAGAEVPCNQWPEYRSNPNKRKAVCKSDCSKWTYKQCRAEEVETD